MTMAVYPLDLPGCFRVAPSVYSDNRGTFVKPFQRTLFEAHGINFEVAEQYYAHSVAGSLRGMHFQLPPHEHAKLVSCIAGTIVDVIVDLRTNSPTYRQHCAISLNGEEAHVLYLPSGIAHGYYCETDATILYSTTSEYNADCDSGIRYDSFGYKWPGAQPIISSRDNDFVALHEFSSPFRMERI